MNLLNNKGVVINPDKGILVVFEGISGSGKSASIHHLTRYLLESGFATTSIEWNSNRMIRRVVKLLNRLGVLSPLVFSILQWINFIADYVMIISPSLRRNRIVIADRYIYTALTRDAANGVAGLHGRLLFRLFRIPDIVLFCNTRPETCYERIQARGKPLFHTNKSIARNNFIPNKDLHYLKLMNDEYIKLFSQLITNHRSNVVFLKEETRNSNQIVIDYIHTKWGYPKYKSSTSNAEIL